VYEWQINQIKANWDQEVQELPEDNLHKALVGAGLAPSLVDFLAPLYANVNGASFFNGSFRILPLDGWRQHGMPGIFAWNDLKGWKRFEPEKLSDTFYFCANGFGDLFGIPVTAERELARDRIGMLWVERYEYQEAGVPWKNFFPSIFDQAGYADYFARREAYNWTLNSLGRPSPWQCFSSNVPAVLGGPNTIENLSIQSLSVHVSFTLQLLRLWKEKKLVPGAPVSMVDLYDEEGRLIR
jgi:hypothetical protein